MTKNLRSIVLLCVLACIALFLIGFRLGKQVSTLDKSYVPPTPSLTPTLIPSPTIDTAAALGIPNQVLQDIKNKNCKTTYKLASPEAKIKVRTSTVSIVCTSSTPTLKISPSPSPTSLTTPIPPTL